LSVDFGPEETGMANSPYLVLVDGSSSLYRAFHALPPLSNSRGMPTQAILGFTSMLLKLLREEQPDAVGVAFDGPGPTTRHREYPEYKAQRPEMPEAMVQQIPAVHRVVEAMRIPILMVPGEEADDILATLARRAAADGYTVGLITGDKDLLQVVTDRIVVRDTMKRRTSGPRDVEERYGISPERLPDLLALMGDSIDNIPGIPGVGEKTARDLLQQFGTLEGLLKRAAEVSRPRLRELLQRHAERARMSKHLATVNTDLDLPWAAADLRRQAPDVPALLALFRELEFTRLLQQFSQGHLQTDSS
jgi:5'-3' exonuclease